MKHILTAIALAAAGLGAAGSALAGDEFLKFDGGIGSQPYANVGNVPTPNAVFGINPGGRPWVIRKLRATVTADGRISVKGLGLLLGGGNGVGTIGLDPTNSARVAPRDVSVSLFCNGEATPFNSPAAPLDISTGNFTIKGTLEGVLPQTCAAPVLLVRANTNGTPGPWFAAGIPAGSDDD
jgi:hypothetical protein